jgi:hypothetical protein
VEGLARELEARRVASERVDLADDNGAVVVVLDAERERRG